MSALASWMSGMTPEGKRRLRPLQHLLAVLTCGSDLTRLAKFFGTDKAGAHNYTPNYEAHFRPIRKKSLTVLEIGVGGNQSPESGGSSLRMWRAYFPRARIVGIDLYDKRWHDGSRIKTYQGSQADGDFLLKVIKEIGPPDILIDDGSHRCEHVIASFNILFPHIAMGGIYVCEDLETSYWPETGGNPDNPDDLATSMGYFKSLVHGLNHAEFLEARVNGPFDRTIRSIHFYHNMVFIYKGKNDEPSLRRVHR